MHIKHVIAEYHFLFLLYVLSKLCEEQRDAINNAVREKKK